LATAFFIIGMTLLTGATGAMATGAGIGADGIGAGIAITLAAFTAAGFATGFFLVVFFEVGILHSCFSVGGAARRESPHRSDEPQPAVRS
jgi:hypothetical protein